MLRLIFCMIFGSLAIPAQADELDLKTEFSERYIACYSEFMTDDASRVACYDDLVTTLTAWLKDGTQVPTLCEVEDWKMEMRGTITHISGAASCASGKLAYRLYDDKGNFLTSGVSYFDGFVFEAYPGIPNWPENVNMKYTIEDR